jgi:hypothetical protein
MILISEKMTSQNKLYEIKLVPYNKPLSWWQDILMGRGGE